MGAAPGGVGGMREFVLDALQRGELYWRAYEDLCVSDPALSWEAGHLALAWYSAGLELATMYLGSVGVLNSALRASIVRLPTVRAEYYRESAAAGFSFDQEAYQSLIAPFLPAPGDKADVH